jgi:uncharacterized lipoprotein YmbA
MFGVGCLAVALSGCMSIPNSPTPRFYALSAIDKVSVNKKINLPAGVIIGIGPVRVPEYLDRPQIVTHTKEEMLQFAQFDRWGESLDLGVARLVREDLTVMLPKTKLTLYPWNPSIAVKYQVIIEVVELDNEFDKGMHFAVQWMIIDLRHSKTLIIKRSEFRKPIIPQNYSGLAQTLSTACASLSSQIAEAINSIKTK